ncbi:hypothetical protein V8C35DRAFT_317401 [Trichoderma chlorosporum]
MELDTLKSPQAANLNDVIKTLCNAAESTEAQFVAFRRFYREMTHFEQASDIAISINNPGLTSHAAVLQAVAILKSQCSEAFKLEAFQHAIFPDCLPKDRERAAKIVTQLAFMIDPSSRDGFSIGYRIENEHNFPTKWLPTQTFTQFFTTAFPTESVDCWRSNTRCKRLRAWKLKRRLGIRIRPTNDLAEHLVYTPQTKTLAVFHQVEYLKAQIRYTTDRSLEESVEMSFANGTLPPQLLLETLYTIYFVLFPLTTCPKSAKLAGKLARNKGLDSSSDSSFDPNLIVYDGWVRSPPADFKLVYWTRRLRALQAVADHPPPSNKVISWFERHTSERNALTVAIAGLFLTALFGLLSFLVGVAQLLVAIRMP